MRSIFLPVNAILKNPRANRHSDRLVEISGWVNFLIGAGQDGDRGTVEMHLTAALSLRKPDEKGPTGKIAANTSERIRFSEGEATVLEKRFAVSGEPKGMELNMVLRISANHIDVSHMHLHVIDKQKDL
jgi:hypothetical protein